MKSALAHFKQLADCEGMPANEQVDRVLIRIRLNLAWTLRVRAHGPYGVGR